MGVFMPRYSEEQQPLQFASSILLDEIAVISFEALEKSPDSNVRFCLEARTFPGALATPSP
jgi:hypothetical protein